MSKSRPPHSPSRASGTNGSPSRPRISDLVCGWLAEPFVPSPGTLRGLLAVAGAACATFTAAAADAPFSAERILARTKVLASDEFEGRAPGSPGEDKTVAYLTAEFRQLGLAPGNPDGTYVQAVPLVGITSHPTLAFTIGDEIRALKHVDEFVGPTSRLTPRVEVEDSEVVFVGYGVVAPEYDWDDFKGVDVRGKTIVVLVNDPPVKDPATGELDPHTFGGKAMTYYGRWTYKYEIAAEKGAAACLIVHETEPAAYPWAVVTGSRSLENFELRAADGNAGRAAMDGWLSHDAAKSLFRAAGHDYEALKLAAARRDFRPVALGARASFTIENTLRDVDSRNVVAKLEGSDPQWRDEYVVYTAHWDHLGRDPALDGDQIFNGALDNASGVAVLLEIAQAFASLPPDQRPRRSVLFLSVTAEEKGLLGSRYYAEHPLYPLTHTVANINMDGANTYGPTSDVAVIGLGASTIDDVGLAVAAAQGRRVKPEEHPEHGSYYRSDHFEFAKVGVPAFYPKAGRTYLGQPADFGEKLVQDYIRNHYHKVTDEIRSDWTMTGAVQDAEFMFQVGLRIANEPARPEWKPASEFKARRDAMLQAQSN